MSTPPANGQTPRTIKKILASYGLPDTADFGSSGLYHEIAEHCRQLETELSAMRAATVEEWIVAAAVKTADGAIHFMPKPCRHHHTIHALSKMLGPSNQRGVEGFTTSKGIFVNRIEAMLIATANGQLLKPSSKRELYSEDLW